MSNWKTDFEVEFHLHFKHHNGREEKEIVFYEYENISFLVIDEVKKLWKY